MRSVPGRGLCAPARAAGWADCRCGGPLTVRLRPQAADALLAGHVSAEPGAQWVLQALGLRGMIQAEMRLGEGTGAVAALPLLDLALAVYQSGHTFAQLGIEAYTPQ